MPQVFLSHSTVDSQFVNRVRESLLKAGIDVWKAPESILPGEDWVEAIQRGLFSSTHLVVVMSPAAVKSDWVNYEMNTAIRLQVAGKIVIIPLEYEPSTELPGFWYNYQAIRCGDDHELAVERLVESIRRTARVTASPTPEGRSRAAAVRELPEFTLSDTPEDDIYDEGRPEPPATLPDIVLNLGGDEIALIDEQKLVAAHPVTEHGRVLSGPGTGKSITAIALAEQLLARNEAAKIRFLTFTRATTIELDKRLSQSRVGSVRPSTFHSFAMSVLLANPGCAVYPQPLRLPDEYEYRLIRAHLALRLGVGVRNLDSLITEMAAKWESLNPEEHPDITPGERARFMGTWDEHREVFGYTLVQELPDLLRGALRDYDDLEQVDCDLLIVDEYQDLNACELEVLRRLAARNVSLLAIGDDDQSIYSFRKAHPEGIRRFPEEFGTNRDYRLSVCHRSPRQIVDWAQFVIRGDLNRVEREAPAVRGDAPQGIAALLNFDDGEEEAQGVVDLVRWMIDTQGISPSDIIILYRTDHQRKLTTRLREELYSRDIAIQDPDRVSEILNEPANRKLLAVLRLLIDPSDSLAWWTLIDLQRGLGAAFVDYVYDRALRSGSRYGSAFCALAESGFPDRPRRSLGNAEKLWADITPFVSTPSIPQPEGPFRWGQWIVERSADGGLPPATGDMGDLLLAVDEAMSDETHNLGRYLSQIFPVGKDLAQTRSDAVRIMSMTASKGLTAETVIVYGVDNDYIPRPNADRGEERRLLYVAMTRAQRMLFMTWATRREGPSARLGRENTERRQSSALLRGGPVESQDGRAYIERLIGGGG